MCTLGDAWADVGDSFYGSYPLWSHNCTLEDWAGPHWGDDIPPLVAARAPSCSCVGRSCCPPLVIIAPPLGAQLRLPPPTLFVVSHGTRVPPLACVKAGTCALGGEPGKATRPWEVAAVVVGDWAVGHPSRCSCGGPAALEGQRFKGLCPWRGCVGRMASRAFVRTRGRMVVCYGF